MTMAPRGTRRFIACVGFIETPTNEAYPRILRQPQPDYTIRPLELMPVLQVTGNRTQSVGTIYDVVILGLQLVALGYLKAESAEDEIRIKALKDGQLWMELDTDRARLQEEQFGLEMYGWRVRAVHLGTSPAWILPPVHVWEA